MQKRAGFSFISKIDLSMGFFTFGLDPNAKKLWAISVPFGLYQYLCLPLGLTNRPDIFQSVMHPLFQDMPEVEGFIDAICIFRSGSFNITSKFYPKFFSSGGKRVNSLSTPSNVPGLSPPPIIWAFLLLLRASNQFHPKLRKLVALCALHCRSAYSPS